MFNFQTGADMCGLTPGSLSPGSDNNDDDGDDDNDDDDDNNDDDDDMT